MSKKTNSNDKIDVDKQIEISRKLRNEKIRSLNDWIGFTVSKITGAAFTGIGFSELIAPDLLSLVFDNPLLGIGSGLALLVGRNTVNTIAKIFDILKTEENDRDNI